MLNARLDALLDEPLDWRDRAVPGTGGAVTLGTMGAQGWNLLAGDLLLPVVVLKADALEHNLRTMARWCADHGVLLAPHGKTTMAPQLVERQLDLGAWGVTAATAAQARVFRAFGVERILLANELVDPAALGWVARQLAADPGFWFSCLVDSEAGVALMDGALARAGAERPLPVLVELGAPNARAGCRTDAEAAAVAAAVARSRYLELAGVEGYEGSVRADGSGPVQAAVDRFLDRLRAFTTDLDRQGAFDHADEVIVTAGGSAFFDRVAERLAFPAGRRPVRVVLRSGCYVTHDHGRYARVSPLREGAAPTPLRPALELWGEVLSRPEPGLAIVGFGKRDAPYDLDLPIPLAVVRRSGERPGAEGLRVVELNDQHAFVRVEGELGVGDLVGCGISHPCTTFDKWRLIPLVDDGYRVTGGIRTFF